MSVPINIFCLLWDLSVRQLGSLLFNCLFHFFSTGDRQLIQVLCESLQTDLELNAGINSYPQDIVLSEYSRISADYNFTTFVQTESPAISVALDWSIAIA